MSSKSNNPVQLKSVRATFRTGGVSVTDGGTLSSALGDFARASAVIYPGDTSGTAQLPFEQIAAIMGEAQRNVLNLESAAFEGGISGDSEVTFEGFAVQPVLQASAGFFGPVVHAVHATALVQRLDFSMYLDDSLHMDDVEVGDIVETMRQVLQRTVRYWLTAVFPSLTDAEKGTALRMHEQNVRPLQVLDSILGASEKHEIEGLAELLNTVAIVRHEIIRHIQRSLSVSVGSFWPAFTQLCRGFGLVYAPVIGDQDSNGRLINVRKELEAAADLDADGTSFQPSLARPEMPVSYVIIPKVPAPVNFRAAEPSSRVLPNQVTRTNIRYPANQVTGKGYAAAVPEFLSPVFQLITSGYSGYGRTASSERFRSELARLRQLTQESTDAIHKFLEGYARSIFHAIQLQDSTASLSTPLNLSVETGKAYTVSIRGTALFKGLLAQVSHSVSCRVGSPAASSSLGFSHVQWGSFRVTN